MSTATKIFMILAILSASAAIDSAADPCLVVYPEGSCDYRYDITEYFTVGFGDSLYDPAYDRGGQVLIERGTLSIDQSIYQAPSINAFEPSADGMEGYFFYESKFILIIDGFSNEPVTYDDVVLVFEDLAQSGCEGKVLINGSPLDGFTYHAGSLSVTTPTAEGNNYSDMISLEIEWLGCYGMNVWAYADTDGSGMFEGGECFTAFSHDVTISTEPSSWGKIKSLYK